MPIAKLKPITFQPPKPNLPEIRKNVLKDVVVDGISEPLDRLTMFVEGTPWVVTYYSQVKVPDNATMSLDTNASGIQQQYQKIENFELRVTQGLTQDYDSTTGLTRVSGTSNVFPAIVPIMDDMIIGAAATGRIGIYRVNNVERTAIALKSAHAINYTLVSFIDENPLELENLESKVIRTYFFDKERVLEGGFPLLKEEDHNAFNELEDIYRNIIDYYFDNFYNPSMQAIVIPGQKEHIVDTFLLEFLLSIIEVSDHPLILKHRRFFTDNDPYMDQNNLWDMLLDRNARMLEQINQKYQYISVSTFNRSSWLKGLAYSGVKYVAYPKTPDLTVKTQKDTNAKIGMTIELTPTTNRRGVASTAIVQSYPTGTGNMVKIFPVLTDDYYVFSQNFYDSTSGLSLLEKLVLEFLRHEAINPTELIALLSDFNSWARLEQFYYLPICLMMVKQCRLELYS